MVSLGAIVVETGLSNTFYAEFRPVSDLWIPESLAVSGHSREKCMGFPSAEDSMKQFDEWVRSLRRPMFISDNNGFDWQFVNWYFWKFLGRNPFGHSSTNLGSLYKGLMKDTTTNFKHLRVTKHTHHPVDDAKGNAEAFLFCKRTLGLKTP
jgi:hypothetical protein